MNNEELLDLLRRGEEYMKRFTDAFTLRQRPEWNDVEVANRWRDKVNQLLRQPPTKADKAHAREVLLPNCPNCHEPRWVKDVGCLRCGHTPRIGQPETKAGGCMACGGLGYIDDPGNPCDCTAENGGGKV